MEVEELYSRAHEQYKAKKFDEALKLIDELKAANPYYLKTYPLEARILQDSHNYIKEIAVMEKFLSQIKVIDKKFSQATISRECKSLTENALSCMGTAYRHLGMPQTSIKCLLNAAKLSKDNKSAAEKISATLFAACYSENFSPEDFHRLYTEYNNYMSDIVPYPRKFYSHEKIRVGFITRDFSLHVAINWSWTLLTKLNKNSFEVYCYSNVNQPDNITDYLRSNISSWREISKLTDEETAKLIRDDEIDILFDLSGHTTGNRLRAMAYRPASVQVSGIGYMNSTGFDAIDYFLSDIYCAEKSAEYFTEKLIILPHSHICYTPMNNLAPAAEPPCLANGYVTFGCFNQFGKVTDSILQVWKKILDAVPNSRLILKHKLFAADDGKKFVSERLKSFGFDLARVEMRKFTNDYLREYSEIDIQLDTFPYTGGVTTCEALHMGVPVINRYGDRHGTRFGLSILSNIGLEGFAVDNFDDYTKIAIALANDWDLLKILRKNLRGMMENSPLMDSKSYIRNVEKAFIKILHDEEEKFS